MGKDIQGQMENNAFNTMSKQYWNVFLIVVVKRIEAKLIES